jgi:glutaredoxin
MLASKQILSTGKSLVGRSTVQRVDALINAFGLPLPLTSKAAVPSIHCFSKSVTKNRSFSTAAAEAEAQSPARVDVDPSVTVKLYQYHICPFCNTAKAVLAYANVPYEAVEVNPLTKAELKWYVRSQFVLDRKMQRSPFFFDTVD